MVFKLVNVVLALIPPCPPSSLTISNSLGVQGLILNPWAEGGGGEEGGGEREEGGGGSNEGEG